ncbi:toxin-antitoxin system YwqK family antitoxin [Solirubrum puertoriconensis]|uniref:MORN repeat variant n=1 Tax=Solirubrum puertoriconensis TaxID=1751427 RepID=A0A9X0HN99_SOLP1|nr:hypothetical protein [Solirubrum puertoriconensis]KUG09119.1 hypothetical protein ASU33_20085 [Solirubrum puertoriconensis]
MIRNFYLPTFLCLASIAGYGQTTASTTANLAPVDTAYFDQDWERTNIPEDRVYARIARHDAAGNTIGTVRDYYLPSWKKQWEGKLAGENPDVATGLCTSWYQNGRLQSRGTYVQGQKQRDFQEWREDGKPVKCRYVYQPALETSTGKLHSYYNEGSSRKVFEVILPANTAGFVYKLDIRDEGEPPVSWSTALALSSIVIDPTMSTATALMAGSKVMAAQGQSTAPTKSTKCHWYITDNPNDALQFVETKGYIKDTNRCYRVAANICQETRQMTVQPGTERLYICVNNDNSMTSATATVSVSALTQACK